MTVTDLVIDDALVKDLAFGEADDLWPIASSDRYIDQLYEATRALVSATHSQLEQANIEAGRGLGMDPEWRGACASIHRHCIQLLRRVKPMAMDYRRRTNCVKRNDKTHLFRQAIVNHRDAFAADDTLEPTPFDLALWAALAEADAL